MATEKISSSSSDIKPHRWFSPKAFLKSKNPKPKPQTASPASPAKSRARIVEEYRTVFSHFDADGDGKISGDELRSYFTSVGEAVSWVAESESLDFEGFVSLMDRSDCDGDGDLKTAFEMFEADKGSGFITPDGLRNMLSRLGDSRPSKDCESMISAFDLDGNGVLDFNEFVHMMTSSN